MNTNLPWLTNAVDHVWHVWINSEGKFDEKAGDDRPMKFDPHEEGLYDFKSALGLLTGLGARLAKDRRQELPQVHQQCSHSAPEAIEEPNHLTCALGQKLTECPILQRLRATFDEYRKKPYYASIAERHVDEVAAATCVWHLLSTAMQGRGFVDWNEGAVQDVSDRMFWNRVYDNLSSQPEPPQRVEGETT